MGELLVYATYMLICAFIASYIAHRKRRSVGLWFLLGGLLGFFGILIISLLDTAGLEWVQRKRK